MMMSSTVAACHASPRRVTIPRRLNSPAIARSVKSNPALRVSRSIFPPTTPLAPHQWIGIIAAVTRSKAPMKFVVFAALVVATLSGCATSVARLGEDDIDVSISSTFPAQQVAGCLALWLQGANPTVTLSPDHYVISRANGYGFPVVRWDIKTTPTGSVIEGRTRLNINNGTDKARSCAANPSTVSR